MRINQLVKETLSTHKNKIEIVQWAIISSVSSLIYSEYIKQITQKQVPIRIIFVPALKTVREILRPDGQFMDMLSNRLIDEMMKNKWFVKYSSAPELVLFQEDQIEIMKTIFDLYIIPNISRRIPEAIEKKFRLDDETNQTFRESREADLFGRNPISDDQFNYVVEEAVLQLLVLLPTMKKDIDLPEKNLNIHMSASRILTIDHENAMSPIHFSDSIIENKSVIELLKFVTNTTIKRIDDGVDALQDDYGEIVRYSIDTSVFNQVALVKFQGIGE